jgi:hypothetical protein
MKIRLPIRALMAGFSGTATGLSVKKADMIDNTIAQPGEQPAFLHETPSLPMNPAIRHLSAGGIEQELGSQRN